MENNIEISSYLFLISDGSEVRPILSYIFELKDINKIECGKNIQRIPNIMNIFKTTKKRGKENKKS